MSDIQLSELVKSVLDGKQEAFRHIYTQTVDRVYRTLFILSDGSIRDAEDITQNVYLELYRNLNQFDPTRSLHGWLYGITLRQLQSYRRKRWKELRKEQKERDRQYILHSGASASEVDFTDECVLHELDVLSDKLRQVLVLRYLKGYSQQEIAELLNIPVGTVKSRLHQALRKMKEHLTKTQQIHPSSQPRAQLSERIMQHIIEMHGSRGQVLAKIQIDSLAPACPTNQMEETIRMVIQSLSPGEGKAIYIAGEGNTVNQQTNYRALPWTQGLESLMAAVTPLKPLLPANVLPRDILVYNGFDNASEEEIESMAAEARRTGKSVIVRDLHPNDVIVGIQLIYQQDGFPWEYRIFKTTKSRIQVPDMMGQTIQPLTIRGHEAVYLSNTGIQQLIWAEWDNSLNQAIQYEITSNSNDWDSQHLIAVANSLTQHMIITDHDPTGSPSACTRP
ncbi:hypothetical protein JCM10914A_18360 [Paenibacillus sp. JCM 10914]|uniref:RNA polymerase sigma factor n=1 Tax=Paenibacillus sp. JCM 10914 TaxID=1236974 RepID=UPI00068D06DA|nr:sigma-70 family RNA polymerase sigma factor [Paenibacillus sp. JCM 10914]